MNILIDNRSGTPIYTQIYTQIKDQIINGTLKPEDPLPSIRTLAKDLRISVITTKRAYEELEAAGYIYTLPGKGSFVAPRNEALLREEHLRQLEEHLQEVRRLARLCGLSREELTELYDTWEDDI